VLSERDVGIADCNSQGNQLLPRCNFPLSEFRSQAVLANLELWRVRLLWLHETFGEEGIVGRIHRDETGTCGDSKAIEYW